MSKSESYIGFGSERAFLLEISALLLALCLVMVLAAGAGAVAIPGREVLSILWNRLGLTQASSYWPASHEVILLQIRFPRVLGAALVGAALSCAGALFQGLLRNPMADPFIIGTSGGAALGGALGVLPRPPRLLVGCGALSPLSLLGVSGGGGCFLSLAGERRKTAFSTPPSRG